jgi:hypothetical protein
MDSRLILFDSSGRRLTTLGRRGEGPGEFLQLRHLFGWAGDSVWAFDLRGDRIHFFSATGRHVGTVQLDGAVPTASEATRLPRIGKLFPEAVFAGKLVAEGYTTLPPTAPGCRGYCFVVATLDGGLTELLTDISVGAPVRSITTGDGDPHLVPLAHARWFDVASDGSLFADAVAVAEPGGSGRIRVTLQRPTGDTVFSRLYEFAPIPVPSSVRDSLARYRASNVGSGAALGTLTARLRDAMPTIYDPVRQVRIALDKSVWLCLRDTRPGALCLVLDAAGTVVRRIRLPATVMEVAEINGDRIWAVERGADDVRSVVRYRTIYR